MADSKNYPSIEELYKTVKDEYAYQRNRMQRIESKIKVIITILTTVFTFEIANAFSVLDLNLKIDSVDSLKVFFKAGLANIPYVVSIVSMVAAIILLLIVTFSLKCKYLDVVKLYNNKIYNEPIEVVVPFYTVSYVKCIFENNKRFNRLYRFNNAVIFLSVISFISFCISYLF